MKDIFEFKTNYFEDGFYGVCKEDRIEVGQISDEYLIRFNRDYGAVSFILSKEEMKDFVEHLNKLMEN